MTKKTISDWRFFQGTRLKRHKPIISFAEPTIMHVKLFLYCETKDMHHVAENEQTGRSIMQLRNMSKHLRHESLYSVQETGTSN
jgi:hypothetical protein